MVTLRASKIFSDSRRLLIVVEAVNFRHGKMSSNYLLYGNIEPVAVVVCGSGGTYALDMKAKPVALDQLRQNTPELDALITSFNP